MKNHREVCERGQSLLEIAIVMPIILLLLGGLVEISNLLIAQNRVVTGTRAATSFGTTSFREDALPSGWADSMAGVALNSVLNTPQADSMLWEFAVVRAQTNADGDGFARWDIAFPNGTAPESMPSSEQLQADVLSELGSGQPAASLDLLITVANTEYQSLLNLDAIFDAYPSKLTAINVGLVDREKEPVLYCLEEGESGAARIQYAVDINGAHVAQPDGEPASYLTLRTWNGGQEHVQYTAANAGNRISFGGGDLGESGVVETDRFKMVVSGAPAMVGVRTSAGGQQDLVQVDLHVGESATDRNGFTTTVTAIAPGADGRIITFEVASNALGEGKGSAALDHVIFKFVGSDSECIEWGVPQDTGDYSGTLGP